VAGGWVAPTTPSALAGSLNSLLQAAESAAPATSSLLQLQQADATEALRGPASSAASEATPASVSSSPSTAFSSVLSSSRGRGAPGWTFPDRKASESLSSMPPVGAAASNPLSSSAGAAGATGVSLSGIQAALQAASGRVFEVQKISSGTIRTGKPATLQVDAGQGALVRYNPKKQTRKVFPAETLLKLQRSAANMRKLKVFWRRKDGPARYIFQTAEERERFVEAAAWLRTATALAAVPSTPQPSAQPQSQAQASVSASALLVQGAVQQEEIKVLCGTWNMGNAPPPSDPALWEAWLSREARYDLVAVAVQECEYAPGPGASNCEEDFFERVHRHLGEQYVRIGAQSLLAIRLLVLARREHAHKITRVRKGKEATGIGNVYGNKGAVAISLQFNETSICFVGSHLAARDERIRERNQNYMDIVARLHLAPAPFDILTYHEHVFWLGDLNYRVQIPRERAIELLQQGTPRALEELLERDQLREQLACGNAFAGFSEGPLSFLPTYRYVRGPPGQALAYSDEKMRTPSWCDRILYRSHPNRSLTLVAYRSVPEFGTSDHKPVLAAFRLRTLLTNLPHPQQPCRLQFSGLALELDPSAARHHHGAPPDPYVSFHARFLEQPLSSEPLRRCFAGQWRDDQLPCLEPFVTNREFLEMQSLLVHVRDQRQVLGSGVLSLQGALSHRGVAFEVALYLHGRRAGLLRGRLQGIYEEERQASPGVISLTPQTLAGGKQGYLLKQGGRRKNWKRRWVELLPPNTVRYSASRDALQILGSFSLLASDVGEMPAAAVDKQNCFYCRTPKRLWLFCADTYGEMREWLEAFRHAIATASSHPT
jgi:endonuclease/exonuclease/phosphatase family metal-dependent hydrolase